MDTHSFKIGDKVKHKTTNDFVMVIVDFAVYWHGDPEKYPKTLDGTKNYDYPICKYYNIHTKEWEQIRFHYSDLVLLD
jgi:hypothetical protein